MFPEKFISLQITVTINTILKNDFTTWIFAAFYLR